MPRSDPATTDHAGALNLASKGFKARCPPKRQIMSASRLSRTFQPQSQGGQAAKNAHHKAPRPFGICCGAWSVAGLASMLAGHDLKWTTLLVVQILGAASLHVRQTLQHASQPQMLICA